MSRPPTDLQVVAKAFALLRSGETVAQVARMCGVSDSAVHVWRRRYKDQFGGCRKDPPPILCVPDPRQEGAPERGIARDLTALARSLRLEGQEKRAELVARAVFLLAGSEDMPDPKVDQRGWILAMIARVQRSFEKADAAGNAVSAKHYALSLATWATKLRQYDAASGGEDVFTIPRKELDSRVSDLRSLIRSYSTEPPRCSVCDRKIRASWGEED